MAQYLTWLYNLYGPGSPIAPIWGDANAILTITAALTNNHLSVSNEQTPAELPEGPFATQRAFEYLMQEGTIPEWFTRINDLSQEQQFGRGFEDFDTWNLKSTGEMQALGDPPFKNLDIAETLFGLRRASRCREFGNENKLVFQLGVLTYEMYPNGKTRYTAQVFPADEGNVTHTVWLYRYCIFRNEVQYEEHWRAFMAPRGDRVAVPVADVAVLEGSNVATPEVDHFATAQQPANPEPIAPQTPQKQHKTAYQTPPATRKRNAPHGEDATGGASDPMDTPASPSSTPGARRTKAPRATHYSDFDHSRLTVAQLMAADPALLMGDALLRLAHHNSNQAIFEGINRHHPDAIAAANVVTKRIGAAIKLEAKNNGEPEDVARARLGEIRDANGVVHKQKRDVEPYRRRPARRDGEGGRGGGRGGAVA